MTDFLEKNPQNPPYQKIEKMEKTLEEINTKLNDVLRKSDQSFIKDLIKETVNEMKKAILESVEQRVGVLEGEIHELAVQNDKLHNELKGKTKEINLLKENATDCAKLKEKIVNQNSEMQALKENNQTMRDRLNREINYNEGAQNDAEQYSRMNNIRLYGLKDDDPKQTSGMTAELVVTELNNQLKINLTMNDISIAHRLGRYLPGRTRPTIVQFVRREVKGTVMKNVKELKNSGMSISHDLTRLNQQVLQSIRLKDRDKEVDDVWYSNGKIFVSKRAPGKNGKLENRTFQIKQRDFAYWLRKDWPEKRNIEQESRYADKVTMSMTINNENVQL